MSLAALLATRYAPPEWAIFYEVGNGTGANVRRHADAVAEGIEPSRVPGVGSDAALVGAYLKLWDEINGARAPWASNPWVWVVTFRRL